MKTMQKRILSLFLAVMMIVSIIPMGTITASAANSFNYNADAAINFAKVHCATDAKNHSATGGTGACDNGWLCAEFVAECLVAGGFPKKLSAVAGMSGFAGQITNYGEKISCSKTGEGYVKMTSFSKTLSKGDPIVILYSKASGSGNGHVVIYSGETADGIPKVYAHNNRKQNEKLYVSSKTVEIFAVHISSSNDNNSKIIFNKNDFTLGLNNNKTATVVATIEGDYAHWQCDWDGNIIGVEKTQNGNKLTINVSSRSMGTSFLSLKAQDKNYNTLAEAAIDVTVAYDGNDSFPFSYNANGGTGNMQPFSVKYNNSFIVLNNSCTKEGYHFSGWNVKRNNDNTWATSGHGWLTEDQLNEQGYSKQVFDNNSIYTLDSSWTYGLKSVGSYTFYATWIKDNVSMLFDQNGGRGEMSPLSTEFGLEYTFPDCEFTRDGYVFSGWNVYRVNDGTWATDGHGWLTESELKAQNCLKQMFCSGDVKTFDDSWKNGCSDEYMQYIAYASWTACNHRFVIIDEKAADCINEGYIKYSCTICSSKKVGKIPAKGHIVVDVLGRPATCTSAGLTDGSKCSICGVIIKAQENIPMIAHNYISEVIAPTVNSQGYTLYTCSVCGNNYKDNYTDPIATNSPIVVSIIVVLLPTKTVYTVGEKFSSNGLAIKVNMSDGTSKTITSGFTVSSPDMTTAGTKTVTVRYQEKTVSFSIVVNVVDTNKPLIKIQAGKAGCGQRIRIPVIVENTNLSTLEMNITYDSSKLKIVSVDNMPFDTHYTNIKTPGEIRIAASDDKGVSAGNIAVLTFDVIADDTCHTDISATVSEAYDSNDNSVDLTVFNNSLEIINVLSGDINGDGIVDANDYAMVRSCVMCEAELTEEQRIAADFDRDGAVDAFDAIAIDVYLNTKA